MNNQFTVYSRIVDFQKRHPDIFFTDLSVICLREGWNLIPYTNRDRKAVNISKDGFCFYDAGEYNIFYNRSMPKTRQRFTIAHEIGHIWLDHHKNLPPSVLRYGKNGLWEYHANIFARNVLFPTWYACALETFPVEQISEYLGLSKAMIKVRYNVLEEDLAEERKILKGRRNEKA